MHPMLQLQRLCRTDFPIRIRRYPRGTWNRPRQAGRTNALVPRVFWLVFYWGWFHLVGSILSGEAAMLIQGNVGNFCFEQFQRGLEFGFTTNLCLVPEVFAELPITQLEFQTLIPWVLTKRAPEA